MAQLRAANSLLISKTKETEEAKLFLSKYPGAKISFDVGPGYSQVMYVAGNVTRFLTLSVKTTPIGNPIEISVECLRDGSVMKIPDVLRYIETSECLS